MGLIPEDKIAEIRDRTDIIAVIGEHVPLRRAGTNHVGLCPFHAEKTPSFNVNPQKGFFYCFGCQKSGDVFRFVMELEGRSFAEVARDLARRAGVDIPEFEAPGQRLQKQQAEGEKQKLLRVCDIAAAWFESQLPRAPRATAYLQERGVSPDIVRHFRLGYAPDGWDGLVQHLHNRGVPHELSEKAGLLIRKEEAERLPPRAPAQKGTHYDRFRDRVIFPLITPNGEVIAFGGRVLPSQAPVQKDKEPAKYINSPESPLYKKGDNLYGLHAARDSIRKSRQVILVEGNFDVLSLHQHGVTQAVAPMGTALTETQVRLLKRLLGQEGHVVLMLDGDRAGRSATLKDIWLFSQANLEDLSLFTGAEVDVRVVQLPDGEDPDTYVARDRPAFDRRLKSAKPAVDYVLDEAIKLAEHDNVAGKAKVLMQVAPLLSAISNPTTLDMYVDRLAGELAISPSLVRRHVQAETQKARASISRAAAVQAPPGAGHQGRPIASPGQAPAQTPGQSPVQMDRQRAAPQPARKKNDPVEMTLVALIGDHPALLPHLRDELVDRLSDPALADMLREARDLATEGSVSVHQLIELAPPELRDAVASAALGGTFSKQDNPAQALETIANRICKLAEDREMQELRLAHLRAVQAGDERRGQELMLRIREIQQGREIRMLRGDPTRP